MIYGFILWLSISFFTNDVDTKIENSNNNVTRDIKIEGNGDNTFNQYIYNNAIKSQDTLSKNEVPFRFEENDTILNILITRFENTSDDKGTRCIGIKFEDELNKLKEKKLLRINPIYLDDVGSPKNSKQAKEKQFKHNADLLIYGKAEIKEICSQAEFCFKYILADTIASILPPDSLAKQARKTNIQKFDSFKDLIIGELSIDGRKLEAWLLPYIAMKDKDLGGALDFIVNLNNLNIRCFDVASIYRQAAARLIDFKNDYVDYEIAEKYCLNALKINKCDLEARKLLVKFYHRSQEWEKAITQSQMLFSVNRQFYDCLSKKDFLNLVIAKKECGDFSSAINLYNSFLNEYNAYHFKLCENEQIIHLGECRKPKDYYSAKAYFNRAICHASLGNKIYACRDISKALDNNYQLEWRINEIIDTYDL